MSGERAAHALALHTILSSYIQYLFADTEEIDITEQANRIDDTAVVEEPALPSTDADSEKDDIDKKDNEPKDMTDDEWAPDQRDKDAEPKKMRFVLFSLHLVLRFPFSSSTAALPKSLCEYAEDQIRKFTLKIVREDGLLMRLKMIQVTVMLCQKLPFYSHAYVLPHSHQPRILSYLYLVLFSEP